MFINTGTRIFRGFMDFVSFLTEDCVIDPQVTRVYFENEYIGELEYDSSRDGFVVYPAFALYSGFFKTREVATIELVFHYYSQTRDIPVC